MTAPPRRLARSESLGDAAPRSGALAAAATLLARAGFTVMPDADGRQPLPEPGSGARLVLLDADVWLRAERLQACASKLLEAISLGEPLMAVLEMLARGVEEIESEALVSILLVDPDGVHLRHGAAPSLPDSYVRAIDGVACGPSVGSCGTAVYRRETVIVADIERDPLWAEYRELPLAYGLRACWSTPVQDVAGNVLATFAVYYREPRAPRPEDRELLDRMAHVVRIAIERDRREGELRRSQALLRMASQVSRLGAWSFDLPGLELSWSEEARAIHEVEPDAAPTVDELLACYPPEHRETVRRACEACIQDGTSFDVQAPFVTARGHERWLRIIGEAVRDATGAIARVQGAVQDVTAQKQAEAGQRALEEQLHQAQRLDAIGQLTGGIAHDFNNLLTVILGNADILVEELAAQPELLAAAETIARAAERGAALTQRLLAFARKQPLDPKAVEVNQLVGGMDTLLRRTLGEHIQIELILDARIGRAFVDPAQLEGALLNLCLNARDAMPTGGRLSIETASAHLDEAYAACHPEVQPGPYVLLAVSDTGLGIAPEHLEHVFEPFFTTKSKGRGTGLGLATVYGFMKQSGGHVSIESEPGRGTTVRLYLPCQGEAPPWPEHGAPTAEVAGGAETILLVEDEPQVRRYARDQLLALGYRVIEAEHGPRALEIVRQRADLDLLFTDVVMPGGLNGRQLAEEATRLRPGLKVLYASGHTESAIVDQGRLIAGIHFLAKPYRRAELARKVREALA